MFQMMGVFAEFERAMIVERVRAGIARVRETARTKSGRPIDRPRTVTPAVVRRVREARSAGLSIRATAPRLGISTASVMRAGRKGV